MVHHEKCSVELEEIVGGEGNGRTRGRRHDPLVGLEFVGEGRIDAHGDGGWTILEGNW